jgi:hypothetical protein
LPLGVLVGPMKKKDLREEKHEARNRKR